MHLRSPVNRLSHRLGIDVPPSLRGELTSGLARAEQLGLSLLELEGRRLAGAHCPLALPSAFIDMLEVTVSEARASDVGDHADALVRQYVESLPLALVLQQCSTTRPNRWLFHDPVDWPAMARFHRGLAGLFAMLADAGIEPAQVMGANTSEAWLARFQTLGQCYASTYFGSSFPMFAAYGPGLAALEAEVADLDDSRRWEVVDYRLGAALLHEVLHFGREREALFPPYLDEAVAGYLGVRLLRETAFPAPGEDNALDGFPWFAQVGQALVRAFGLGPVLSAHCGVRPWPSVLGEALVTALDRLGWEAYRAGRPLHFHPDTTRPDRWAKLFYLAARGEPLDVTFDALDGLRMCDLELPQRNDDLEAEMMAHALAAMALERVFRDPVWRIRQAVSPVAVRLDFERGVAEAVGPGPAPLHVLPPGVCAARVAAGERRRETSTSDFERDLDHG